MTRRRWFGWLLAVLCCAGGSTASAADWIHWRGPEQTGQSRETNLPDDWDPATPGRSNLIWKQPFGCRSTPLVLNGKVFINGAQGDTPFVPGQKEKLVTGERVVGFDAKTGKKLWEKHFNVFHTDIVTNRLGWSPLAADPENGLIFAHLTGGQLLALKADTGDVAWEHSLTEEYGRVTGYGGRIGGGPIYDSGLVIVGMVNSSWGNYGIGGNRWVAFDSKTGKVVWWAEAPAPMKLTYYSHPVVAVIAGQRLMIAGGADGGLHAFQLRTGKRVWSYSLAAGVINPGPVVSGDLIYIAHGEENADGGARGRVVCMNGAKVTAGKPALVWEKKGILFGLSSLALADGKLYLPDDGAKLYCFDAKTGKILWKYNYGTTARGAPIIADGKIYLSETHAKFHIIHLNGDNEPDEAKTQTVSFRNKPGAAGTVEVNSTPSVADGRVYLATRDDLYCIGKPDWKPTSPALPAAIPETATPEGTPIAQLQIIPAEIAAKPGEKLSFELRAFSAAGAPLKLPADAATWDLIQPQPAPPKAGAPPAKTPPPLPPKLDGTIDPASGAVIVGRRPSQQGYVEAKIGTVTARARVRVAASTTYTQDFEAVPIGGVPGGWVNTQGKYSVVEWADPKSGAKSKVLFKKNDDPRPPLSRANGYITGPDATEYTIEADVMGIEKKGKLADSGIVANRYTFFLDGKTDEAGQREARLVSWEALPRINVAIPFTWKSETWYRLKMSVEAGDKDGPGIVKCKVWERGTAEPAAWGIQFKDPMPNRNGAAGVYGYIPNAEGANNPGSEIYFDNVAITPNKK